MEALEKYNWHLQNGTWKLVEFVKLCNLPLCLSLIGLWFAPTLVYLVHLMALRFGVSGDSVVAGYIIVVDLNSVQPDSSVVRAFGIYPEGPGFKSLSGHFYMFNRIATWNEGYWI